MSEDTSTKESKSKARPIQCVVSSDKMEKTRVGTLERTVKHTRYFKYLRRRSKFMFHDENNESKVGDLVLLVPARPLSAHKRFKLLKVVERAKQ